MRTGGLLGCAARRFTTVAPLVIVLAINAIKEIVDDYYRHKVRGSRLATYEGTHGRRICMPQRAFARRAAVGSPQHCMKAETALFHTRRPMSCSVLPCPAQSDGEINSRLVLVLEEGGKETEVTWKDLEVGDLVKVSRLAVGRFEQKRICRRPRSLHCLA